MGVSWAVSWLCSNGVTRPLLSERKNIPWELDSSLWPWKVRVVKTWSRRKRAWLDLHLPTRSREYHHKPPFISEAFVPIRFLASITNNTPKKIHSSATLQLGFSGLCVAHWESWLRYNELLCKRWCYLLSISFFLISALHHSYYSFLSTCFPATWELIFSKSRRFHDIILPRPPTRPTSASVALDCMCCGLRPITGTRTD